MNTKVSVLVIAFLLQRQRASAQSNIGDFVGQLTSLLNQGGGLASVLQGQGLGGATPGAFGQQPGGYFGQPGGGGVGGFLGRPGVGGVGGGGGGGGYGFQRPPGLGRPPPGQPPPGFQPQGGYPGALGGGGYAPTSLYGALASIAQFDDLRCVPRLLCEVAAGARPGSEQNNLGSSSSSSSSAIPFLSKDAVITLLTVLNFVDDSPLLVFGRAAILGYTARGDPRACLVAYPTCPRDPDKLVDYLNNHNGGFFRFFSNQQIPQYAPQYQYYQHPQTQGPIPPYPYPPPPGGPPPPQYPSQYPRPQYYRPQRPIRRPPPGLAPQPLRPSYPQYPTNPYYQQQGRIQNSPLGSNNVNYNSLSHSEGTTKFVFSNNDNGLAQEFNNGVNQLNFPESGSSYYDYTKYNDYNNKNGDNKRLVFPVTGPGAQSSFNDQTSSPSSSSSSQSSSLFRDIIKSSTGISSGGKFTRKGKTLSFPSVDSNRQQEVLKGTSQMVFPDRTGTGDLRLDLDEYGDYKTVHFASEVQSYPGIFRDQRDIVKILKFPAGDENGGDKFRDRDVSADSTMSFPRV